MMQALGPMPAAPAEIPFQHDVKMMAAKPIVVPKTEDKDLKRSSDGGFVWE